MEKGGNLRLPNRHTIRRRENALKAADSAWLWLVKSSGWLFLHVGNCCTGPGFGASCDPVPAAATSYDDRAQNLIDASDD